ncbi:hypothetical protein A3N51_19475 [Enterobacter kobei]|nr:hypothetical protein A3N51_19475 [Enterobacter kobei]
MLPLLRTQRLRVFIQPANVAVALFPPAIGGERGDLLSDKWLVTLNATDDVAEIVLPDGEWRAVPPFAGADNPVVMAVWHGPAHGVCVFQR